MEAVATIYSGEIKPLAQRVNEYLVANKMTKAELANELKYSRTTISRYLSGKYDSDTTELEARLKDYLNKKVERKEGVPAASEPLFPWLPKKKGFFENKDAASVIGLCSSCQEEMGLGIVIGKSGFGKTHALKYYSKMPRVAYVECDDVMSSRDLIEAIEKALGIPQTYGTIWKRVNGIREFFNVNQGYLLIIDEADKLISKYTQKKMEILRGIFDQSDVGIVIAGEPRLEAQIKSYLARFANRIDFYVSLKGLTSQEVEKYLGEYKIEPDAMNELISRACNHQTGCFRLLGRTLDNVIRIMNANGQEVITLKIISQASKMMML